MCYEITLFVDKACNRGLSIGLKLDKGGCFFLSQE